VSAKIVEILVGVSLKNMKGRAPGTEVQNINYEITFKKAVEPCGQIFCPPISSHNEFSANITATVIL